MNITLRVLDLSKTSSPGHLGCPASFRCDFPLWRAGVGVTSPFPVFSLKPVIFQEVEDSKRTNVSWLSRSVIVYNLGLVGSGDEFCNKLLLNKFWSATTTLPAIVREPHYPALLIFPSRWLSSNLGPPLPLDSSVASSITWTLLIETVVLEVLGHFTPKFHSPDGMLDLVMQSSITVKILLIL